MAEPDGVPQEAWIRLGAVQEIVRTPKGVKRQRKSLRPSTGTEAQFSYLLTAVADGFAMTLVRNETQRHSTALKSAGQNPISLLPLAK